MSIDRKDEQRDESIIDKEVTRVGKGMVLFLKKGVINTQKPGKGLRAYRKKNTKKKWW